LYGAVSLVKFDRDKPERNLFMPSGGRFCRRRLNVYVGLVARFKIQPMGIDSDPNRSGGSSNVRIGGVTFHYFGVANARHRPPEAAQRV
jgi:hypothetical protein